MGRHRCRVPARARVGVVGARAATRRAAGWSSRRLRSGGVRPVLEWVIGGCSVVISKRCSRRPARRRWGRYCRRAPVGAPGCRLRAPHRRRSPAASWRLGQYIEPPTFSGATGAKLFGQCTPWPESLRRRRVDTATASTEPALRCWPLAGGAGHHRWPSPMSGDGRTGRAAGDHGRWVRPRGDGRVMGNCTCSGSATW